jgi:hypothetical protein
MQQMMQQLLARMEEMNANQEKAEADRVANRECMKQVMARTGDN